MIRDGKERMNLILDFSDRKAQARGFAPVERRLPGQSPALAITPVAAGRTGAYEANQAATWALVERVARLLEDHVRFYDGLSPDVSDHVRDTTDPTWPESYWVPCGMSAFEYMRLILFGFASAGVFVLIGIFVAIHPVARNDKDILGDIVVG